MNCANRIFALIAMYYVGSCLILSAQEVTQPPVVTPGPPLNMCYIPDTLPCSPFAPPVNNCSSYQCQLVFVPGQNPGDPPIPVQVCKSQVFQRAKPNTSYTTAALAISGALSIGTGNLSVYCQEAVSCNYNGVCGAAGRCSDAGPWVNIGSPTYNIVFYGSCP